MVKIIKTFFRDFEKICSGVLLLVMLIVLAYQVFARYVLHNVPQWPEELARYLFIWFIFLTASLAGRENAHIRIETLQNVFPRVMRKFVKVLGELILVVACLYMAWASGKYTLTLFTMKQVSVATGIQIAYIYLAIPVGFVLLAVRSAVNIFTGKVFKIENLDEEYALETAIEEEADDQRGGE